jgi:histidine phosphotransfer protein HptB
MIDWTRVSDLRAEIGDDSFAEVTELFLEETDEVIARLSGTGLTPGIGHDLHFLKGSSLNLGFSDLAELCQDGERRAMAGEGASVDLGRILDCYAASKAGFLHGLERQSAA